MTCGSIQPARFLGQHDRDAVADRKSELRRARDQLLLLGIVFKRRLGQRTDQDFQKLGIDAIGGAIGHKSLQLGRYCNEVSPDVLLLASSISVTAIRISARVLRS